MASHGQELLEHDIPLVGLDRFDLGDHSQQVLAERLHGFEPERGETDDGVIEEPIGRLQTETVVPDRFLKIERLSIDEPIQWDALGHLRSHHTVMQSRPMIVDLALIVGHSQQLFILAILATTPSSILHNRNVVRLDSPLDLTVQLQTVAVALLGVQHVHRVGREALQIVQPRANHRRARSSILCSAQSGPRS